MECDVEVVGDCGVVVWVMVDELDDFGWFVEGVDLFVDVWVVDDVC